ncbi:hypothetical protein [Desulfoplanes formicivorans]|uniref:Uncharacterized protein n=1 Tax=Desulfoplanes formicivorans TaxID=1592317 RepID=A0A194AHS7_9BACT|nr:hypothetical protein [Desulfoplanes formicivorans]GAU08878.1 hypothetical protein DPF_1595 [Desulfoplanes formicivorans]
MDLDKLPKELIEDFFPDGFSLKDEANAITAYCFRNGMIEDLHAGEASDLLKDKSISRISNEEMKQLMIEASNKVYGLLKLKKFEPEKYDLMIKSYGLMYCRNWNR